MKFRLMLMIATLATSVLAQPAPLGPGPGRAMFAWWDSPLVRDLHLSEDQQRQIRETVREYRNRLIDLRAAAEKAEAELEDAFNDEIFDSRRANEAIERSVAARGELMRSVSQMSARLRGVLTAEQWRELQKRRSEQRGEVRERVRERLMQPRSGEPQRWKGPPAKQD